MFFGNVCFRYVSAMREHQAGLLIHSRDSPASSRLECGLTHTCVVVVAACSSWMHVWSTACVYIFLVTHSGSPQDDATSPSSIMTSSKCRNLHNIFLILTAVDCGLLIDPANGQVTLTAGTSLGQTATYSCSTGYNLVGDSTRTCQATGVWSGRVPTCQGLCVYEVINPSYPMVMELESSDFGSVF